MSNVYIEVVVGSNLSATEVAEFQVKKRMIIIDCKYKVVLCEGDIW